MMIRNNKILLVGIWYSLLIIALILVFTMPESNFIGPAFGILYLAYTLFIYMWVFKTIDRNAFLMNIIFFFTFVALLFLFNSYKPMRYFLSFPNFVFLFGFILSCWIPVYLIPTIPTTYNAILLSRFKEASILGGLIGAFVGWVLMGAEIGRTDISSLEQLTYFMSGFYRASLSVLYGLGLSLIVFGSSNTESNISPDQSCFEKVEKEEGINFKSLFAFPVLLTTSLGIIAHRVYFEGARGNFKDFFQLGSIPLILFILLSTKIITGNKNFLSSLKILIYDKHGEYDIKQTSSTINLIKQLIIYSTIFLVIMLFMGSLNNNITKTFQLVSDISAILFSLFIVYFIIIIQDIEILQNAILKDKFDEYQYKENSSGVYIVSTLYIGILSLVVLLNLIRT